MKIHVKTVMSALLLGGILATASGCTSGQTNHNERGTVKPNGFATPSQMPHVANKTTPNDKHKLHLSSKNYDEVGRINRNQLARIVVQVPGVEHADVVMNSTDVLVGIGIDNIGKRKIIEKQVYSALQWQYPEYKYYVTSDEELHKKIIAVNERAENGYNTQLFDQDISAIAKAIAYSQTKP
ncbi:YhcN/YlaJ family sporulation lipoprotein [Paenibacillus sp. GSMTC-2017]|uniref:YhcN/YlaJ family sporulation lipoprotein n=1 Tax=Paenibacillus sp. GSMTC-2017 TaxID=2794350 RepID=UPI0018D9D986|nr:YhcN/YlaJ family sporulation lipoprotein [Paenibacillus sp. GSMTC-2017]MBH5319281.1 YhcN/YlaJ family sporulation lipoprotein [Paenibacillus sp. GSMTC-2017]